MLDQDVEHGLHVVRRWVERDQQIGKVVALAIDDDRPVIVRDGEVEAGVITRADLLRTVIEGTEVS